MDEKKLAAEIFENLKNGKTLSILSLLLTKGEDTKTKILKMTKTPFLNSIGRELGKLLVAESWKYERLKDLWKEGGRDEKLIVISALGKLSKKDYTNTKNFIMDILEDIRDWEICDQLALRVIVNLVVKNPDEMFDVMLKWLKSEDLWIRRLAVATIPPYIRAKKTEAKRCLTFLDNVMREQEQNVKKAVGWALREISKKDKESVFNFLKKWAKEDNKDTKWIIKDGMKKLEQTEQTELKKLLEKN